MTLFVTSNEHKFNEINNVLGTLGFEISWGRVKYEEIQADSTAVISLDSARKLAVRLKEDFFLEDTGLYIESLKGFPGPYSSFVSATVGNEGILKLLQGKGRAARFMTVITYHSQGKFLQFEGVLEGTIGNSILGEGGFGFDPIFIPEGSDKTLAEMSVSEKNSISHRTRAIQKLVEYWKSQ